MNPKRFFQFLLFGPALVSFVIVGEIVLGSSLDGVFGLPRLSDVFLDSIVASLFLAGGLAIVAFAGWKLLRSGGGVPYGDVVKSLQTRNLVKTGPYRFCRNPMILGYALILSSVGLYRGSVAGALLVPVIALLLLSVWIRFVEEQGLEERFGGEYRSYRQTVPFLIPLRRKRREE